MTFHHSYTLLFFKLKPRVYKYQHHNGWQLLLKINNRSTLSYISKLKKDEYTADFFAGYPNPSSSKVTYWNEKVAVTKL